MATTTPAVAAPADILTALNPPAPATKPPAAAPAKPAPLKPLDQPDIAYAPIPIAAPAIPIPIFAKMAPLTSSNSLEERTYMLLLVYLKLGE